MSTATFCPDCGAILPICETRQVDCRICKVQVDLSDKVDAEVTYTVHFNELDVYTRGREAASAGQGAASGESASGPAGPLAEKSCPRCNHPEMTYATAQLRSADEGQTIFYTCPKCGFKFSENS